MQSRHRPLLQGTHTQVSHIYNEKTHLNFIIFIPFEHVQMFDMEFN
jgi:hypothetical protein